MGFLIVQIDLNKCKSGRRNITEIGGGGGEGGVGAQVSVLVEQIVSSPIIDTTALNSEF